MKSTGKIAEEEFEEATIEPVQLSHGKTRMEAPHFVQWVLGNLVDRTPEGVLPIPDKKLAPAIRALSQRSNSTIQTTLDLDLQHDTERIVEYQLKKLKEKNVTSAAVVVLDAKNGDILTMLGSADFYDDEHDGQVNVAVTARQPGSALKPFTYALGLSQGMTAATTIVDTLTQYTTQEGNPYTPRNYDYDEHGLVRVREALANSYNIPAVKTLERVGVDRLLTFLRAAGITTLTESPEHYGLALTLGDGEVRLLELASAYGIFARGGRILKPRAMLSDHRAPEGALPSILDPRVAWLIADILSDDRARLQEFGSDGPLHFDFPVAAKTGTTRNSRDNWTIGFTADRIVGVWVGNADNSPMKGTSGVTGAGPIFHDVMERAMRGLAKQALPRPNGHVTVEICTLSGKLPTPLCPEKMHELFLAGTEPKARDDVYQELTIDRRNQLLAGPDCPLQYTEKQVFTALPIELHQWAREHGFHLPPREYSPLCKGQTAAVQSAAVLEITSPDDGASFLLDPLIPDENEQLVLEARGNDAVREVVWSVDGVVVGTAGSPDFQLKWRPTVGTHVIEARAKDLRIVRRIEVVDGR